MFSSRTHAFEPSTWAEVEDAASSRKESVVRSSKGNDPVLQDVLSFTNAPVRCIFADIPELRAAPANRAGKRPRPVGAESSLVNPHGGGIPSSREHHVRRGKRGLTQIDDILGLGRIDLETGKFVRRYTLDHPAPNPAPSLPCPREAAGRLDEESEEFSGQAVQAVNPSSADFSPTKYLSRMHKESSIEELRAGLKSLRLVSDNLSYRAEDLRSSSHASIALGAAVVEQTRRLASDAAGFRSILGVVGGDGIVFQEAGHGLGKRYHHVLERQARIDQLKNVRSTLGRFPWIFTLPASLRAAGKAEVANVEETARLLARARQWTAAQNSDPGGPGRLWIREDLDNALEEFISCLASRLSRSATSGEKEQIPRLVEVLELVERDVVVTKCLDARLKNARDALLRCGRSGVNSIARPKVGNVDTRPMNGVPDMLRRLSSEFVDGLQEYWDLARVVVPKKSEWEQLVDKSLPHLVTDFVEIVQGILASGSPGTVGKVAAMEVGRVHYRAVSQLEVPGKYLEPVETVANKLVDGHLALLTRAVKASAKTLTRRCFETETVGTQLPLLGEALVEETVADARDLLTSSDIMSLVKSNETEDASSIGQSHFQALAVACIRVPEFVVRRLRALVAERSRGCHIVGGSSVASSSLQSTAASSQSASEAPQTLNQTSVSDVYGACVLGTARCCNVLLDQSGIQKIADCVRAVVWNDALQRQQESVTKRIRIVATEVVRVYCKRLCPEVRFSTRRIAELQSNEGLRSSHSLEIDRASTQAVEVLFNVALAVCRARKLGATTTELDLIEKEFADEVAEVLLTSMNNCTTGGAKDVVAQIWVDIVFLMKAFGNTRESQGGGKARDAFVKARDKAASAIRAGGFAFGIAEEETLRETAILPSVARARLLIQAVNGQSTQRILPSPSWIRQTTSDAMRQVIDFHV